MSNIIAKILCYISLLAPDLKTVSKSDTTHGVSTAESSTSFPAILMSFLQCRPSNANKMPDLHSLKYDELILFWQCKCSYQSHVLPAGSSDWCIFLLYLMSTETQPFKNFLNHYMM